MNAAELKSYLVEELHKRTGTPREQLTDLDAQTLLDKAEAANKIDLN